MYHKHYHHNRTLRRLVMWNDEVTWVDQVIFPLVVFGQVARNFTKNTTFLRIIFDNLHLDMSHTLITLLFRCDTKSTSKSRFLKKKVVTWLHNITNQLEVLFQFIKKKCTEDIFTPDCQRNHFTAIQLILSPHNF